MKTLSYVMGLMILLSVGSKSYGQEKDSDGYNPFSVHPIHKSDIMYEKRIWRRIDLKEKQNKPFFSNNNEITKIIIEAVEAGVLQPYANDSLKTRMTKEQFMQNLQIPNTGGGLSEEEKALGFQEESTDWGAAGGEDTTATSSTGGTEYFFPNEVSVMELVEDMIFDKKRSRMYYDIQAIKLVIPAEKFETGLIKEVGVFAYKELVELFRSMPDEAIWFNPWNTAEHKNLADAFDLRLFSSHITKIANPENSEIVDVYTKSQKEGIFASEWLEMQLMEYEHELWEF